MSYKDELVVDKKKKKHKKRRKNSSNEVLNVFIVLFIFVACMSVFYVVITRLEDTNNDGRLIDELFKGKMEELDLTNEDVSMLYNIFAEDSQLKLEYGEKINKSIHSKLFFTFNALREEFKEVSCDEMGLVILYDESNYVSAMCSMDFQETDKIENKEKEIRTRTTFGISEKKFKKKYIELFGEDAEYKKLDFEHSLGQIMHYDSRSDMYVKYYNEVKSNTEVISAAFKDATLRSNELTIGINYVTTTMAGAKREYYVNYTFKKLDDHKYKFLERKEFDN